MAKLTLDIAKEIARNREGECLSKKYVNSKTPMLWKCAKDMYGLQSLIVVPVVCS